MQSMISLDVHSTHGLQLYYQIMLVEETVDIASDNHHTQL